MKITPTYRELYPYGEDPLFQIHLNVDFPFNLTGILYFPHIKNNIDLQRNKIQLYSISVCNRSGWKVVPDFDVAVSGLSTA